MKFTVKLLLLILFPCTFREHTDKIKQQGLCKGVWDIEISFIIDINIRIKTTLFFP